MPGTPGSSSTWGLGLKCLFDPRRRERACGIFVIVALSKNPGDDSYVPPR